METYIPLKTKPEILKISQTCTLVNRVLRDAAQFFKSGCTPMDLDRFCLREIGKAGGICALAGYKGFRGNACISVNQIAAHGIPDTRAFVSGDIVTLDVTVSLSGWHGDAAWTYLVGKAVPERRRLVNAAWKAMLAGIKAAKAGNRMGDIGFAVQKAAIDSGCTVISCFAGHGIGKELHEEPSVLFKGNRGSGRPIVPGMVFTIEPVLTLGKDSVRILSDGWSAVTNDSSVTAQFEQTIAVQSDRTLVLGTPAEMIRDNPFQPPFY